MDVITLSWRDKYLTACYIKCSLYTTVLTIDQSDCLWRALLSGFRQEMSLPVLPICEIFSKQMFKVLPAMPYTVLQILPHKTPQHKFNVAHSYIRDKGSSTGDSELLRWALHCWHTSYRCQSSQADEPLFSRKIYLVLLYKASPGKQPTSCQSWLCFYYMNCI